MRFDRRRKHKGLLPKWSKVGNGSLCGADFARLKLDLGESAERVVQKYMVAWYGTEIQHNYIVTELSKLQHFHPLSYPVPSGPGTASLAAWYLLCEDLSDPCRIRQGCQVIGIR